jgi:hypothetical protein
LVFFIHAFFIHVCIVWCGQCHGIDQMPSNILDQMFETHPILFDMTMRKLQTFHVANILRHQQRQKHVHCAGFGSPLPRRRSYHPLPPRQYSKQQSLRKPMFPVRRQNEQYKNKIVVKGGITTSTAAARTTTTCVVGGRNGSHALDGGADAEHQALLLGELQLFSKQQKARNMKKFSVFDSTFCADDRMCVSQECDTKETTILNENSLVWACLADSCNADQVCLE